MDISSFLEPAAKCVECQGHVGPARHVVLQADDSFVEKFYLCALLEVPTAPMAKEFFHAPYPHPVDDCLLAAFPP